MLQHCSFISILIRTDKLSRDVKTVLPPNDDEFDRYVDEIQRGLAAFDVKQPYSHAIYYSSLAVQPLRYV